MRIDLGGLLGGVSIDKTGLTGRYTMELAYTFPPPPDAWWRARSPTMD
jgi:hypothetical protein